MRRLLGAHLFTCLPLYGQLIDHSYELQIKQIAIVAPSRAPRKIVFKMVDEDIVTWQNAYAGISLLISATSHLEGINGQ